MQGLPLGQALHRHLKVETSLMERLEFVFESSADHPRPPVL